MSQLNEHEKLIRHMQREHRKRIKELTAARDKLQPDTTTWLRFDEAIAKENREHRAECVRLGIIPENLALVSRTEYVYRAVVDSTKTPREYTSDEDQSARQQLDGEFSK